MKLSLGHGHGWYTLALEHDIRELETKYANKAIVLLFLKNMCFLSIVVAALTARFLQHVPLFFFFMFLLKHCLSFGRGYLFRWHKTVSGDNSH